MSSECLSSSQTGSTLQTLHWCVSGHQSREGRKRERSGRERRRRRKKVSDELVEGRMGGRRRGRMVGERKKGKK